jgi:hypothetical protein
LWSCNDRKWFTGQYKQGLFILMNNLTQ